MAPPIRTEDDRKALIEGLKDGTIDAIITDHAPHCNEEKDVPFNCAPNGIAGLETSLASALTVLYNNGFTIDGLIELMSVNPARLLGVEGGVLEEGAAADIVVIDPDKEWTVHGNELYTKSLFTPYEGLTLKGRAVLTVVDGEIVMKEGEGAEMKGLLVLENGARFEGDLLGTVEGMGELVFNTGMTGYQECFTDPSYEGQILTLTYPLIGNYGANDLFMQNRKPAAAGYVLDRITEHPSNWECKEKITDFIERYHVPCLYNVDTRAVTRMVRMQGVMKAVIVSADRGEDFIQEALAKPMHKNQVERVTTAYPYTYGDGKYRVSLLDCGLKKNILVSLAANDCTVHVFPAHTTAEELLASDPDGIFLSPDRETRKDVPYVVETVKKLIGKKPIFGICLGIQMLSTALGAHTFKLPFGHRGSNHPVKDLRTGRVYITSQNHGYAVSDEGLPDCIEVTHRSDGTIEGIRHKTLPIQAVQYHPEASPADRRITSISLLNLRRPWRSSKMINKDVKKVLVIGSGPIVIGQAAEFDYAGTQACRSLRRRRGSCSCQQQSIHNHDRRRYC